LIFKIKLLENPTQNKFQPGGAASSLASALYERRPSVTDRRYKAYFAPDGAFSAVNGNLQICQP